MSRPQPTAYIEENIVAEGMTNPRLKLVGPWMLLYGGTELVNGLDLQAVEANFGVQVGWRTATTGTDVPNAWQPLLTQRTADGTYGDEETFSTTPPKLTDNNMWVQASLWTQLTTGSVPKTALSRLWYSVKGAGWIVGRQQINLPAASSSDIIPIGAPFNCVGVTGLMFGVIYTNLTGTITPEAMVRTFASGNIRKPDAWTSVVGMTTQTGTGTDRRETKSAAVTTTDKIMAQAGFKYSTSGGGSPGGMAEIIVAAKTT